MENKFVWLNSIWGVILFIAAIMGACNEPNKPFLGDYPVTVMQRPAVKILDTTGIEIWKVQVDSSWYLITSVTYGVAIVKHEQ